MSESGDNITADDAAAIELAALWVVRAQAETVSEADIIALTEWLEASDHHAEAYRDAYAVWAGVQQAPAITHEKETASIIAFRARRMKPALKHGFMVWGGGAIAAGLALLVILPMVPHNSVPAVTYATAKGERQSFTLADGTVLMLNTDTRVTTQISKGQRALKLEKGEVALTVVHDASRPFTIDAGDTQISDIGTEFNVLSQDDTVRVTVKSGVVSLKPNAAGSHAIVLRAGELGVHHFGDEDSRLTKVDAQEAFAWQSRHAIYRDQPLSVVVKDLNRYFDKPIIVDEETGKLRLTAILTLDSESSVVGRLEDFLSLDAQSTDRGILLRRSAGSHKP